MHRAFLLLYFAIFARAANPLLTKRQAGPNGAPSKQDLNSINNCLNPEGGIAPNVVGIVNRSSISPLLTQKLPIGIYCVQAQVCHGRNWTMWPAHVA